MPTCSDGLTAAFLASACGGKLLFEGTVPVTSVVIDSRKVTEGALFVAIAGEHTDGHRFVTAAAEHGAAAVLVERPDLPLEDLISHNCSVILCDHTVSAFGKIAAAYKETDTPNIRERLKFFIDQILYSAQNFEHFIKLLEANKYEVRRGKYIAVKPPYGKRSMRLKSLGEDYSEYSLKKRIDGRNDIPNEFADYENRADELQKPFYYAINTSITLIRKFHITPKKHNPNEPYSFLNDHSIENIVSCLNILSEFGIDTREQLYGMSSDLQKRLDSNNSVELKSQLSKIESVIRTYEDIVEGNYIDNLIRAERERKAAAQKNSEQPKYMQTSNRKNKR